ncbi:MAG TPA: hypothetical protein VFE78_22705 [Gemmataceae bacterium]|jgi:hypothetical protein|nr:hypothetical protein [Gemmataceae bacterium]
MTTRFALGLMLGLACGTAACADEVRGRIVGVDPDKHQLRVEVRGRFRGQTLTLQFDDKTQVAFGTQAARAADLTADRRARVVYEDRDGKKVATSIRVLGPRPASAAPADANTITGTLQRVAPTERELVVVGPGAKGPQTETTVAVPEGVKIVKGDKTLTIDVLKEGEQVTVRVDRRGGRPKAVSVHVGPLPAAERSDVIPRLRTALQIADMILRQMEQNQKK